MATDGDSNVFISGRTIRFEGDADIATVAYSSSGTALWTNLYKGMTGHYDMPRKIVVDGNSDVIVVGASGSPTGQQNFVMVKYAGSRPAPIPIQIQRLGNLLQLTWTNAAFGLQSAPSPSGPFTNVVGGTSPHVTPMGDQQQFFRLRAN